jgi:hypothetical protein
MMSGGCYGGLHERDDAASGTEGSADGDGSGGADAGDASDDGSAEPPAAADEVPIVGLRRLTAAEYDATIRDILLDDESGATLLLPTDPRTPFDNDYADQIPSETLVEAAELLATDAADRLIDDPARISSLLPCSPSSPTDEACMQAFAQQWGRRALRRPPTAEEVTLWLHGEGGGGGAIEIADEQGDFAWGVHTLVRTLLQDPEFLYRVELGTPVTGDPTLFRLGDFEIATRLSYFLWGSAPDDWMLDRAELGTLSTPAEVREVATMMLADDRALERVDRFHAMWLGYESMPFGGQVALDMKQETKSLVQRVVFDEDRPWQDLFRSTETFLTDTLAEHYGLPAPDAATGAWVDYGDSGRQGLLSHGTFLSIGAKFGDTSPVQRGLAVRTRVFCQVIPPPPPGVDPDQQPGGPAAICKEDRYAAHSAGGCAGCHAQLDPVGFGLEGYGPTGQFRAFEADDPDTVEDESLCAISGSGELVGVGAFSGPAQLADLALSERYLDECVQQQLMRFVNGRFELDEIDEAYLESVRAQVGDGDFTFRTLLLEMVGSETFGYRREEAVQ